MSVIRNGNLTLALAVWWRRLWAGSGCGGSGRSTGWCGWAVASLLRRCCRGAVCWRPAISLPAQSVVVGEVGRCVGIRKKHSKNSYHMVCHHTLSKNGMISYHQIVISYQINFISSPLVCHHTNICHFILYRYQFILVHVISYRKGISSYQYMSLYTGVVSYQNMSFHTPWYVIIPTIAISYHTGIISYQYMSVHTVKVSFHTSTCHCILVLFHTKTCHFIPLGMSSYQQLSIYTIQVWHHTHKCHFIPMKCV